MFIEDYGRKFNVSSRGVIHARTPTGRALQSRAVGDSILCTEMVPIIGLDKQTRVEAITIFFHKAEFVQQLYLGHTTKVKYYSQLIDKLTTLDDALRHAMSKLHL